MTLKPRKEESLKDQVYRSMYKAITEGQYQPRHRFTEKELVEKYNISKSPIREALIELCNEGVLRAIPRFGYEVLQISEDDIKNVKNARLILEIGALDAYFDRITEDDLDSLEQLLKEKKTEEVSILEHWERNSRFHLELMECYRNAYLTDMLKKSLSVMTRAYTQYQYRKHQKTSFTGTSMKHNNVLQAIRRGDKAEAIACLEADIGTFETN